MLNSHFAFFFSKRLTYAANLILLKVQSISSIKILSFNISSKACSIEFYPTIKDESEFFSKRKQQKFGQHNYDDN